MKHLITILAILLFVAGCEEGQLSNTFRAATHTPERQRQIRMQQEQEMRDMERWQHQTESRWHHFQESLKD